MGYRKIDFTAMNAAIPKLKRTVRETYKNTLQKCIDSLRTLMPQT